MSKMSTFIEDYPYLYSQFIGLMVYLGLYLVFPKQRRIMILSSLLAAPTAILALVTNPFYWRPKLIVPMPVGIEDIIFDFINGGTVWMASAGILTWIKPQIVHPVFSARRAILSCVFGITASGVLFLVGFRSIDAPFIAMIVWLILMICIRKENWLLVCIGAPAFTILYIFVFKTVMVFWPQFLSVWKGGGIWGWYFWEIPLGEIVWAALFGAVWPITIAYIFDMRFDQSGKGDLNVGRQEGKPLTGGGK